MPHSGRALQPLGELAPAWANSTTTTQKSRILPDILTEDGTDSALHKLSLPFSVPLNYEDGKKAVRLTSQGCHSGTKLLIVLEHRRVGAYVSSSLAGQKHGSLGE